MNSFMSYQMKFCGKTLIAVIARKIFGGLIGVTLILIAWFSDGSFRKLQN